MSGLLRILRCLPALLLCGSLLLTSPRNHAGAEPGRGVVAAEGLRGKVLCGYQGWFRCPGDASGLGWVHWSRDTRRIAPETLTFDLWPDLTGFGPGERFAAPGFSYPDGRPAELFSSDEPATVLRHFAWMRQYGIDGVWLQHFVVDLPGGPVQERYPSRLRVLQHVRRAAQKTGRVWALSYDIAGAPQDTLFRVLTDDWRKMVEDGITADPRYLRVRGRPVVQIWGFYRHHAAHHLTPELANRLIAFFHTPGRYAAYLVGGGDWDWRQNPDPEWRAFLRHLDAYVPWNVGNYSTDGAGKKVATTSYWAEDRAECGRHGVLWIPSVYPGFSWDHLQQKPPGTTTIPRRRGAFYWEQFYQAAKLGGDAAYVAMFDEVDEGTAIFKVTSTPPAQAPFQGYEGLPSDWYLRLTGEGARMLRGLRPLTPEMPSKP